MVTLDKRLATLEADRTRRKSATEMTDVELLQASLFAVMGQHLSSELVAEFLAMSDDDLRLRFAELGVIP